MTWGKVDDRLHRHRKARQAKLEAMGLWVLALSFCADNLTDGVILDDEVASLCDGRRAVASKLADRLVTVGLWHRVDGGYLFHDWAQYQPTRASVQAERARKAEAGRRGAESRWSSRPPTTPRPIAGAINAAIAAPMAGAFGRRDAPDPDPDQIFKSGTGSSRTRAYEAEPPVPDPAPASTPRFSNNSGRDPGPRLAIASNYAASVAQAAARQIVVQRPAEVPPNGEPESEKG